jgi:hypothetical protein
MRMRPIAHTSPPRRLRIPPLPGCYRPLAARPADQAEREFLAPLATADAAAFRAARRAVARPGLIVPPVPG